MSAVNEPDKVGCPAGQYLPENTPICEACKVGYYCEAWHYDNGVLSYQYDAKQSDNLKACPKNTTTDPSAKTIGECFANSDTKFKDKFDTYNIPGLRVYVYPGP